MTSTSEKRHVAFSSDTGATSADENNGDDDVFFHPSSDGKSDVGGNVEDTSSFGDVNRAFVSGIPTSTSGDDDDVEFEADSKQSRRRDRRRRSEPDLGMEFTRWREAVVWVCFVFYVSDLLLDAWVLRTFLLADNVRQAWFMGFCMLVPNLYAGYKSLQWYLREFRDQVGTRTTDPKLWLIRVLFFPISLVLRYFDVLRRGYRARSAAAKGDTKKQRDLMVKFVSESSEVAMLRLFVIFLEDAPICVLNLMLVFATGPDNIHDVGYSVGVVVAKLSCSITLGVVHYASITKVAWHACHFTASLAAQQGIPQATDADNSHILTTRSSRRSLRKKESSPVPAATKEQFHDRANLSPPALLLLYCWQFTNIGSRVVLYALFASVFPVWVPLLAAVRWLLNTVWILVDVPNMSLANCASFGGVYLFTFVSTSTSAQYLRIAVYYLINVVEAVAVSVLWWTLRPDSPYHVLGFSLLVAGTGVSVLWMMAYYGLAHPNRKNTWGCGLCNRQDSTNL